ncbi:DUF5004 domain-containing protein [Sphingobacterium sp. Mn56C]|uniref:DUF5004 domain-containing protein n=1 Tax=Sphingobacterium sp. Mn56C TaxID=3395261 RepID=UPI003BD6CADE
MINKTSLLAVVFAFVLIQQTGCNKTKDGSFVEPITLYEKVKGTWKLDDITQIDHIAQELDSKHKELDMYTELGFPSFQLKLNVDDKNAPTSYEVLGNAPELFPNSGFWELNVAFIQANGTSPQLLLYSDAEKSNLTAKLHVTTIPGTADKMDIVLTRYAEGVAYVSYHYKLSTK